MRATRAMIGAACILAGIFGVISGADQVQTNRTGLVVHEWGTFTSFSGSDGVPAKFHPEGGADLPQFVYSPGRYAKGANPGFVSLETPVLYFYADRPMTASVRAEFPTGTFTEWFPNAGRPAEKVLDWTGIRIRPSDAGTLPTAAGPKRYYAAREVDAAPIAVVTKDEHKGVREHEKFLFYRGVGDPKPPLTVKAIGGGSFSLGVTGDAPISAALLVEVKVGRVRFRPIDPIPSGVTTAATLLADWSDMEPVRGALVATLIRSGLFEKEARAMVKTWESAWLGEEGTRVLYILPTNWTDRTIPLKVTPTPDTLVRVMVGRHDVLTPEREREIDGLVERTNGQEKADQTAAWAVLNKLGRFTQPAMIQATQRLEKRK
jgi:hypothetical protein